MLEIGFPLLSLIIFLPLLGAIITIVIRDAELAKLSALTFAALELILTLLALYLFDKTSGDFQLTEKLAWIPFLNIEYLLGVDGISILFLPLSSLLTVTVILASWNAISHNQHFHFALILALQGITAGVFTALDMMLFFFFWELTLPPLFFLIGLWGIGAQRRQAAMKYTLFMLAGGGPLLLAIVIMAANHATQVGGNFPQDLSFSLIALLETPLPAEKQTLVFVLLLFGFAFKAPLFPFHTWLPSTAMEGPTHIIALLTGLKLGVYGILRFAMPLAPAAAVEFSWILSLFGAATLIYGGLIALQQTNLRRLLAYASISHVGMVVVGVASLNMQGIQGAIFQLLNFTLIASSLMLIAGFIQRRLGSTDTVHLGGLAKVMPKLTYFYFIFALASFGIPGTSGFPAELLIIIGALTSHTVFGTAVLAGAILGATYMLTFTRHAFFGQVTHAAVSHVQDLKFREFFLLCMPAVLILFFGFYPNAILSINQIASEIWLARFLPAPVMP